MPGAGANEDFEKQILVANSKCTEFFRLMRQDKEQALLMPPFEFEVNKITRPLPDKALNSAPLFCQEAVH